MAAKASPVKFTPWPKTDLDQGCILIFRSNEGTVLINSGCQFLKMACSDEM